MAPANRMPMSDTRKIAMVGLIVVGVFLFCCGAGMSSVAVGSIGVILAVGGPILIFATTMRGNVRSYVFGTARVVEVPPQPSIGPTGRGEFGLVVYARGIDGVAVRIRDPAIPLNKWPQVGATLPVRTVAGSPRKTIILWADVRTHEEATYDDRINPEYTDLSDEERGPGFDEGEEFDHGPLPPDDSPTMTDIPPVPASGPPASDGPAGGETERSASVAVVERRRPSPRPRRPVHDEPEPQLVAAAAEPIAEPEAVVDEQEPDVVLDEQEPEAVVLDEQAPEAVVLDEPEPEAVVDEEPEPEEAQPEAEAEPEEVEAEEAEAEEPEAEPEAAEAEYVEAEELEAEEAEAEEAEVEEEQAEEAEAEAVEAEAAAPVAAQESVIGPGDVEREIIAPNPYVTDTYLPMPDPRPTSPGPRHRAPEADVAIDETDPADELEEELPLGAVAEFLPATPQRRPVPLEGVNGVSVTLIVSDLQRSLRFYRETLGLHEVDSNGSSAVLSTGDARVVLRRSADMPPVDRRVVHLNLEVPDVYDAYERLKADGVEFVHRPRVVPQGEQLDLCTATFRDPDGHAIALTRWELRR